MVIASFKKNRYVTISRDAFSPMDVAGSQPVGPDSASNDATSSVKCSVWSEIHRSNSSFAGGNSDRATRFTALHRAVKTMAGLPRDHAFFVDRHAADRASDILGVISENFDVQPPRVLAQDGEAVVFTWDYGNLKRYLTIDPDDVDVMDLHKASMFRCVHEVTIEGEEPYSDLLGIIGLNPTSRTVENDA